MVHVLTSTGQQSGNSHLYIVPLESTRQYFLYHFFINQTCHVHATGWRLKMNLITLISIINYMYIFLLYTQLNTCNYIDLWSCFPRIFMNSSRNCFVLIFLIKKNIYFTIFALCLISSIKEHL